jgi:hypothetical protein
MDGTPAIAALVTATLLPVGGPYTSLRVVGISFPDYEFQATVAAGTGTIAVDIDPATLDALVYELPDGVTTANIPPSWRAVEGSLLTSVPNYGSDENYNVGGVERLYVQLSSLAGPGGTETGTNLTYTSRVDIGPAIIP